MPNMSTRNASEASICSNSDCPASTVSKMRLRRAISSFAGTDKVEPSADGARVCTSALCTSFRPLAGVNPAFRNSFSASRADATIASTRGQSLSRRHGLQGCPLDASGERESGRYLYCAVLAVDQSLGRLLVDEFPLLRDVGHDARNLLECVRDTYAHGATRSCATCFGRW